MPGKSTAFTPSSILCRPHHQRSAGPFMVEAPGTAPGSERCITLPVYRHSRPKPAKGDIGQTSARLKASSAGRGGQLTIQVTPPAMAR